MITTRRETQRILVSLMVAISRAGVARAQEMSGNKADEVKKDIIKLEEEKAAIILKGEQLPRTTMTDFMTTRPT
jgi:hypothetical protein